MPSSARYVEIAAGLLTSRWGWLVEGTRHDFQVSEGLPIGAELVDVELMKDGALRLWFTHESFEHHEEQEVRVRFQPMPGEKKR